MPRHEFDPTAVTATIPVFAKGDYEFVVGEPKAFEKTNQEGKNSFGIRYSLQCAEVIEGDEARKGVRTVYSCYLHGEAGGFGKAFVMACNGYPMNDTGEKQFNKDFAGADWGYDTDAGSCGDVWRSCTGKRVIGALDVQANINTGEPMQQFKNFRPIGS